MPDTIKDARAAVVAERERIQSSIRELEAQLSEADQVLASLDRLMGGGAAATAGGRGRGRRGGRSAEGNGRAARGGATRGRRTRNGEPSMVALIESYLELQGRRSAHGDEILEHLSSINRAPGGKNPKGTLRTTLAQLEKRGRIRNIGRNRWRINRGRPASSGRRSEAVPEAEAASA